MQKFTLILILTLVWRVGFAQIGLIDSLKEQLALVRMDTSRVNTLRNLCTEYWGVNPDSSLKYGQESLALSQKIHHPFGEARAFHALGVLYRRLGDYPKSLEANFKGLQIAEKEQLPLPTISAVETLHATSLQHSAYQPTVTVSTQKIDDQILIKVQDNGNGIPESIRDKIFQPFFTTKPTGQGTGLGLSLAYDIVTKGHGGTINLQSNTGKGTTFSIWLPI